MGSKKLAVFSVLIFVIALIIFGVTIYMVYYKEPPKPRTYTFDLGEFSTNIGASGRYFKGNIIVETTGRKTPDIISKNIEAIRDYVLKLIISQNIKDMTTGEGIKNLSEKIKNQISEMTSTEDITNVYFTEYIVQ